MGKIDNLKFEKIQSDKEDNDQGWNKKQKDNTVKPINNLDNKVDDDFQYPSNPKNDENNQDISSLVGKVDIRQLENYSQNDTDAYSYSGALCRANQGLMEFVEMFKAPIKVLHPLLTCLLVLLNIN